MTADLKEQAEDAYAGGQLAAAISLQQQIVREAPGDAAELTQLGQWLLFADRHAEAVPPLRQAVHLDRRRLDAYRYLALSLHQLGKTPEARAALAQAEIATAAAVDLSYVSRTYSLIGQEDEALRTIDAAIAREPGDAELWVFRALSLEALGRRQEAVQACEQALLIDPLDDVAANNRAVFQAALRRTPRAG